MNVAYIKELQRRLRLLSHMDDRFLPITVDGIYGADTAAAIRAFQQAVGLPTTGHADEYTARLLGEAYHDYRQLTADPRAVCPFPSPYFVMREGERGTVVWILQAMLTEICTPYSKPTAPSPNGVFDENTARCIRHWQTVLGLPENGEVDRFCWDKLADVYNMRLL